jgi:proteasome lid subunit RPN8/RPN11
MRDIAYLSDESSPLRVAFSRAAMELIRERGLEGLTALPRGGMGVGGLLLGERHEGWTRLLDSIELPCSHSVGPSFELTMGEMAQTTQLMAGEGPLHVIGWYCSKTHGPVTLSEGDLTLYEQLFPQPWQIALVLRPSAIQPMRAAFYFRNDDGVVTKAFEWELVELSPASVVDDVDVAQEEKERPATNDLGLMVTKSGDLKFPTLETPEPAHAPARAGYRNSAGIDFHPGNGFVSRAMPRPPLPPPFRPPLPPPFIAEDRFFQEQAVPRRKGGLGWLLGIAALLAAGTIAFLTQDLWNPRPRLILRTAEENGVLLIRWNVDAVRGIDRASMLINDGGQLQTLPLDEDQLNAGALRYRAKSQRVTAKLNAGDSSDVTAWFAAEPAPEPAPDPAPPAAAPPPPQKEANPPPAAPKPRVAKPEPRKPVRRPPAPSIRDDR